MLRRGAIIAFSETLRAFGHREKRQRQTLAVVASESGNGRQRVTPLGQRFGDQVLRTSDPRYRTQNNASRNVPE